MSAVLNGEEVLLEPLPREAGTGMQGALESDLARTWHRAGGSVPAHRATDAEEPDEDEDEEDDDFFEDDEELDDEELDEEDLDEYEEDEEFFEDDEEELDEDEDEEEGE